MDGQNIANSSTATRVYWKIGGGALKVASSIALGIITLILALSCIVPVSSVYRVYDNSSVAVNDKYGNPLKDIVAVTSSYIAHGPIEITSDADFAAQATMEGWAGNGTAADPYIITNLNITSEGDCIGIDDTTVYFIIQDCLLTSLVENSGRGFEFVNIEHGLVNSCMIISKGLGMRLAGAHSCRFADNFICGSWGDGVYGFDMYDCTLINNTICDTVWCGAAFGSIVNCSILNNTMYGNLEALIIGSGVNCTIEGNTLCDNSGPGVMMMEGSSNNNLSGNTIGWNSAGNAVDNGTGNSWDDGTSVGNSWGDYNGTGTYSIPGSAGSVDHHPAKADTDPPICDEPEDFEFEAGTTGHTIKWTPSDNHPKSYLVLRNGTYFSLGPWDGSSITISVDSLSYGPHNLTLVAYDTCYNSVSDSMLVTAVDTSVPICSNPSDMHIGEGTTGNAIVWTPWDASPASYSVLRNGIEIDSRPWGGSPIIVSLDGLSLGVYSYTLSLYDRVGLSASDTVIITVLDVTSPTIDSQVPIFYEVGLTGNAIVWHPFDLHPASYSIQRDGSTVRSGAWDGSAITIVVDGLAIGFYNFTVIVRDVQGNWVSGTVLVNVIASPLTPMPVAIAAGGVSLIALLALVVVVRRRRKPKVALPAPGLEKPVDTKVKALRGCEIVGGKFEYKVKVSNDSNWVITNVSVVIVAYPDDCLQLEGSTMRRIPRIEPAGFRSPQFTFTPTKDCVEGQVLATVTYVDYENRTNMIEVEPYVIRSVCDLLKPRKATPDEFDLMLGEMSVASEQRTLDWNPEVLFVRLQALLPAKNFYIIDSTRETSEGEFKGTIEGLAEGKYTGKKVAVRILVSGPVDGNESSVFIEGLGEDDAMLPTTIHELSEGTASWTCLNCGAALSPSEVSQLDQRSPIACRYCGHTLTIDLYRRRSS